jgi:DNA-binding CsgD family transcriptional regulator
MFDVFDPASEHGLIYRALLSEPHSSVAALVERTRLSEQAVEVGLTDLHQAAVVVPADSTRKAWDAVRPDVVVANALRQQHEQRTRIHQAEAGLMEIFHFAHRQSADFLDVERVEGVDAAFARIRAMQEGIRTQRREIDRPPYYWDADEIERQVRLQCEQMAAGIGYRTIYQESEADDPVRSASMMRTVGCGENARVLADPPIKLTIADDQVALLAADPPAGAEGSLVALLVYPSVLLDALVNVFESLWRLAVPINLTRGNQALSEREQAILTLMASGATDEAIARRLGVARRTVVRDVAKLLRQLGATTRFQAGAQAARRGWL